jgi:lysozyme
MNLDLLKKELRSDEGFKPQAYKDSLGFWTIGIGRLCDAGKPGSGLTEEEGLYLLGNDIKRTTDALVAQLPWVKNLSDARQRALVNMAFQLGIDGVLGFKHTLALIQSGDYAAAADNAMQSLWAKQTPNRAKRVTDMIRNG